jgi:phosphatidylserine decarboxylase
VRRSRTATFCLRKASSIIVRIVRIRPLLFSVFSHGYRSAFFQSNSKSNSFQMVTQPIAMYARQRISAQHQTLRRIPILLSQSPCACRCNSSRLFSSSSKNFRQQTNYKDSFRTRLRKALGETKIKWYPIPAAVGIGFLGLGQLYRVNEREKARQREEWDDDGYVKSTGSGGSEGEKDSEGRPKRRQRIRPTGPWFV